jgi:acetolactate synthase-1/2/3 large subunit
MNGAESLVHTLAASGVEVCFANPGTSEMHFVAALDRVPGVRCVLCLFEGGATGAADGYGRMADKPAATLLHLGTGLSNGIANLHNARRAQTPLLNIVGEHALSHLAWDSPLVSDLKGFARPISDWLGSGDTPAAVGAAAAQAIAAARAAPGQVATLVLPADASWGEGGVPAVAAAPASPETVPSQAVQSAVAALRAGDAVLLLGGRALRAEAIALAAAVAARTGAKVLAQPRDARIERGAGRAPIARLPNAVIPALEALAGTRSLILVGSALPVGNFAYPGRPSVMVPEGCVVQTLAEPQQDLLGALRLLAEAVGARAAEAPVVAFNPPELPTGAITPEKIGSMLGALIPENAILCDEAVTTGRTFFHRTREARAHDYLALTGGAIGLGLAMTVGAAIACPDRKVIGLQADGSGMYTVQSLWTHARENLDILTVVFANNAYNVLRSELKNVGASEAGEKARMMLTLDQPAIDWVSLARGLGVPGTRVTTMESLIAAFKAGLATRGPALIEVAL